MRAEFKLPITAITGPATDNEVGLTYIQSALELAAHNARRDAAGLVAVVRMALGRWLDSHESPVTNHESSGGANLATRDSRLLTVDLR
jgi:hypothetical protein